MSTSMDTGNNPKMQKRTTSTTQILEAPTLKPKLKRTHSLPAAAQTMCLPLSETPLKNLPTRNHSPTCKGVGQRGRSHNQNGSSKKGIRDSRGKAVCSLEVEQSSRKGKRIESCVDYGGSSEVSYDAINVHSASSSSTAGHQEANYIPIKAKNAELWNYSYDGIKSTNNHGDMERFPSYPQIVEMVPSQLPELVPDDPEGVEPLLPDLMDDIIGRLPLREVIRLRSELGKGFRNAIHRPAFIWNRPDSEGEFSPSFFKKDDEGDLHWHGFDTKLRKWTRLPSLNLTKKILPSPDPDLFKDYLVAGDGGLLCINVGKSPGCEKLVMCNPLTQQVKVLPPLNHPRHPVLMHLIVDQDSGHYKVFVAGSAAIGTKELSLKTEEYDSRKGVWECPENSDLPCPPFGLNEYQNGVYIKDFESELLFCVAFVDTRGRGVLVYDIERKAWAQGPMKLHIPLVRLELNEVSHLASTQIVECGGSVFVFSEQECGWDDVYFVIYKLSPDGSGDFAWDEVMRRKRSGERGLLVNPEFICAPVSEQELCIFNTVEHTIETINLSNPTEVAPLEAAPISKGNRFHSLNPIGFVFRPSFKSVVCPSRRDAELRCDLKLREYCSECEGKDSVSFVRTDPHMNVDPMVINRPAWVEETGSNVVTGRSEEIETTINSGGSVEKLLEDPGKLCEEIRNFLDGIAGA